MKKTNIVTVYPGASIEKRSALLSFIISIMIVGCTLPSTTTTTENKNTETVKTNSVNESKTNKTEIYLPHLNAASILNKEELAKQKIYTTLTEALKEPDKVFRLHLKDLDMNFDLLSLSPRIGELYNVQDLEIDGVYESLPKEIGKLTQVQQAKFSLPNLKNEPPLELTNWKNLKKLTIDVFTGAKSVENVVKWSTLNKLISLEELRLENEGITQLPKDMFHFVKLSKLELINTRISDLSELAGLSNLTSLDISGDSKITSLPDGSKLTKLKTITLGQLPELTTFFSVIGNKDLMHFRAIDCPKLKIASDYFNTYTFEISFEAFNCPNIEPNKDMLVYKNDNGFTSQNKLYPDLEDDEKGFYNYMNSKNYSVTPDQILITKDKSLVQNIEFFLNNEDDKKVWNMLSEFKNLRRLIIQYNNGIDYTGPELPNVQEIEIFGSNSASSGTFTDFSKLIKACPNLKIFKSSAGTVIFPSVLYDAVNLEYLEVVIWEPKGNYHLELTDKVANWKKLKTLIVILNDYEVFVSGSVTKEINNLTGLEVLEIFFGIEGSNSKRFTYPAGIENLINLKKLKLGNLIADPLGIEKLSLIEKVIYK